MADIEPQIAFVVAVAENGVIGRDGGLPWRLSSDLKMFRRLTMGKLVVTGRHKWRPVVWTSFGSQGIFVVVPRTNFIA